jgi:hypothetical protein
MQSIRRQPIIAPKSMGGELWEDRSNREKFADEVRERQQSVKNGMDTMTRLQAEIDQLRQSGMRYTFTLG